MSRNITNTTNINNGRNITNTGIKTFANTAILPLELTDITSRNSTIGMKGLNGFTANKIIKVNSAGNALSQTAFNITTSLTDGDYVPFFDTSGNFDRITALNLKSYFTDTLYVAQTPLVLFGSRPNTPPTFGLSTLSGYGLSGQIISSSGTALAYSNSCSLSVINTTNWKFN